LLVLRISVDLNQRRKFVSAAIYIVGYVSRSGASQILEEEIMDKDRVAGSAKEIKGTVKQAVGKAVGDAKLESEGKAEKIEGKVQNAIGGLKDTIRDTLKGT